MRAVLIIPADAELNDDVWAKAEAVGANEVAHGVPPRLAAAVASASAAGASLPVLVRETPVMATRTRVEIVPDADGNESLATVTREVEVDRTVTVESV